jgi:fatty acid desaturase
MITRDSNGNKYSLISSIQLQSLSKLRPLSSVGALFVEWLIIAVTVAVHLYFLHPVTYVVIWLIVGTRMYALYSLLHDGIHYLLFPQRQINDWLSRIFLAWPLFTELRSIRKNHLAHHQHLQTPDDPEQTHLNYREFQFPQPAGKLAFTFLKDITGVNFVWYNLIKIINLFLRKNGGKQSSHRQEKQASDQYSFYRFVYYAVIFSVAIYMGWMMYLFLLWIIPYITIYQALNRLRLSTEHFYLGSDKVYQTRTVKLNLIERFLLSPHNLGFHTEHHLYPSVPFYKLPDLHEQLMGKEEYKKNVIVSTSYMEVIKQYAK